MKSNIIIIHTSTIVREGLSAILQKKYQCDCKGYRTPSDVEQTETWDDEKALFLVEDTIANSSSYRHLLESNISLKSINISSLELSKPTLHSIGINASEVNIYEIIDHYFTNKEDLKEENEGLSKRELDVLVEIALGHSNKEIAEKLFISTHTVMSHRKNITSKLGIKSISGLTVYAIINNYIDTSQLNINDLI